mgnify:FL=1
MTKNKKYIWIAILILFFCFAYTTFAVKSSTIKLPIGADSYITGNNIDSAIDSELMTIVKFQDGKNTCYTVITKVAGNKVNTAISCLK